MAAPCHNKMPTGGTPGNWHFWVTGACLSALLVGLAYFNNLSANLRSENFNIARSLVAGQGYSNAIGEPSGPTAWSAPGYPVIQASLLWAGEGDRRFVIAGIVVLHVVVLCGTAFLVLALTRQTSKIGTVAAGVLFLLALCFHFSYWFQVAQDCWLMLLTFDLLVAGICWLSPVDSRPRAALWGLFGGLSALVNPSIGFAWGVLTLVLGCRRRHWSHAALALVFAGLALAPWAIRNYLVFGRLIPIKSNVAYELYQSQCLQDGGLLRGGVFTAHPSHPQSAERQEYKRLGEVAYLDLKKEQFWRAIAADPLDFVERVATRFLAATISYVPFYAGSEARNPWALWARRVTYPLPFLALLFLLWSSIREPLGWPQWTAIGVYLLYLLPYVLASYYERYAIPLVAVKVLLVIWAADRLLCFLSPALGSFSREPWASAGPALARGSRLNGT
jgi:hypothetical protein